jgi:creatinine amidohydrolase
MADNPDCQVKFHNWWSAPETMAKVRATDTVASHASWMESFAWTRLEGVEYPDHQKPMTNLENLRLLNPEGVRELLGDGNFGGYYQRPDEEMQAIWDIATLETRRMLEEKWR